MSEKIKDILSRMTLEEKAEMCSGADFWNFKGIERLGVPSILVTDGPHGLRKQEEGADHLGLNDSVPATCFPSAAGLASTWNRDLLKAVGRTLGTEALAEKVGVLLGPGANIKRSPLCGRNFEYFSEDPYLSEELAASHISGLQEKGVGGSLKHFAVNNQEHRRMSTDAVVDERTLREIYLASFEGAVKKGQPWTVMSAYNKVNGTFASENHRLLTKILREEWGFDGIVVSDWGAVNERVASLKAGLELEMPGTYGIGKKKIMKAVENGELETAQLDQSVERLLELIFTVAEHQKEDVSFDKKVHHSFASEVAAESMVLLKNEDDMLPISKEKDLAVIGALARKPRYQGGGSSNINPTELDDIYDELCRDNTAQVSYSEGYGLGGDEADESLLEEAKMHATEAEAAVLVLGLPDAYESEGYDRTHLSLPENQLRLIEAVSEVQSNIVVVLSNGAPVEMPWLSKVKAVLEGYLGGQALGGAIAKLLYGDVNPSGKLAETFPMKLEDNPSYLNFPGDGDRVEYKEGIHVGYRYYVKKKIEPLFPFGYGLSYTTFEYANLEVEEPENGDYHVKVSVDVKNTGERAGKEVVQLYVKDIESIISRPEKELKGFEKVHLEAGETQTVSFNLDKRSFAFYDVEIEDWRVEGGEFEIAVGLSSRNLRLSETVTVEGSHTKEEKVHRNTTIGDLMKNPKQAEIIKGMMAQMDTPLTQNMDDSSDMGDMMEAMMRYMPLRALSNFSEGKFPEEALQQVIDELNSAK
ncbi:glycoside hydrolase family 3 C-terminal domain-containing protein [Salinicoccus sp. ID82-1]|uniref:glycoside hydrolase family 3 C-terminal domain-containing protein n=1 Tax=Salinicoccus sp. ID82-1 TaxID=2820269 RepID=UPI001F017CCA|nr:glycoside hydrolase family 3 C-terminal domain-containing protein [Salinicoccus sp. ID82-1]MCG1010645.1 glycoside hydrolase family 3 C-terminal domain-containing protein [Salinicoccus sp. ID82-1]